MGQSTFQIDCSQMSTILHCATPRSLILIDEFGKGTNISDGTCVYSLILYSSSNTQKNRYRTVHVGVQHSVGIKGSMSENDRRDSFQRSARVQGTRTVPRKRNSSSSHEKYSGTHTFSHLTLISLTTFFFIYRKRIVWSRSSNYVKSRTRTSSRVPNQTTDCGVLAKQV